MIDVEGHARLMDRERRPAKALPLSGRLTEREGPAVRIEPGREEDFRYLRGWLASSEWLDRLIAATEPEAAAGTDFPCSQGPRLTGCTFFTAGRRLLEWSREAAPARVGKS